VRKRKEYSWNMMDKFIDLHTHSTASDGSMTPRELVRRAKSVGLCAVALTDHDTIEGLKDAIDEGEKVGITVIPGVEISVEYVIEMHLLGYFSENNYNNMKEVLVRLKENRDQRNPKIIKRLNELGFEINMSEVEAEARGKIVGRPHIAQVMVNKGFVKNLDDAFNKYLASRRPAYFKKDRLTPYEGIQEIIRAGGIPVLAHPIHLSLSINKLDALVASLAHDGLKGIEAYYVDNKKDDTGNLLRLAMKYGLIVTGGSDFHGSFKPDIEIGRGRGKLSVPYQLMEGLGY
jgi:predicted metal-dependent phosphoesterase TrpH